MNLLSEITRCCLHLSSMNSKWNSYLLSQNKHNLQRMHSLQRNLWCIARVYKWIFAAVMFHCTTPSNFPLPSFIFVVFIFWVCIAFDYFQSYILEHFFVYYFFLLIHFVSLFSVCFSILQKHNKLLSIMLLHVS